jgi:type I restriction enzyme S subunit
MNWADRVYSLGRGVCSIRGEATTDTRFIKYCLDWKLEALLKYAGGGTFPNLTQDTIRDFEIPFPEHRRKIAAILSSYDDLIENNLRRIKILEEMAQNLYREWFVKFRFPRYQNARFSDSPLGRLPERWEVKRLGDAFLVVLGGTPSRNNPEFWRNGTVPWINSGKVNDLRVTEPSELITEFALKKSAAKLMPPGTTLIAITGATLGQVSFLEIQASANQSVVGVISEDDNLIEWLHMTINEKISGIINHASGGAQQHINKGIVDDVVVAVPPRNIAKDFRNIAHPLYRQIAGLLFKNTTLRHTRDLLLPRLISGEVDVSELDIPVPEEIEA